ncbi:MAG: peptide deformylase [Fimbriimonadaceae bacterium]|nr:peptide deformylase [Alphaproteobacteria bacterium]
MSIREIITIPDPRLRLISKPVAAVDDEIRQLMDDLLETMYAAPGIGLAAIQVAEPVRVLVVDPVREDDEKKPIAMANPEILWVSDEMSTYEEGCLSIPEHYEEVERPARCRVAYLDRDGAAREIECDGLMATVVQHEIEHLNGGLFIDNISKLKRDRIKRKFVKAKKREAVA